MRHWRHRFRANWNTAVDRVGERFCCTWEFYLAICEPRYQNQNRQLATAPVGDNRYPRSSQT
ncbi:MAG: hypothetical protein R6X03_11425 [Methyloceanibacter sp.]